MTNTPRRFDENPNTTTNLQKDSTEYFGISQSGASKVIKTSDAFTKANVGLSEVDNTSDANKPVSVAQQTALDLKADKSDTYTKSEVNALNDAQDVNIITNADNIAIVDGRQNVLLDNKVVNGDFADGAGNLATNFSGYASAITSWISGVQSFTATVNNSGIKYDNKIPVNINDYISVIAKIKKNVTHTATDIIQVGVLLYDVGGSIIGTSLGDCNLTNDYDYCSTKVKITNINATHAVPFVYKPSSADVTDISATEIFYFNVSEIFGTDKEPNAKLMQKFIENIGYFEGAHTMTNKEITLAYSEYLKDIDTAITELGGTI